jgi:LPS sulfotransferase NodH
MANGETMQTIQTFVIAAVERTGSNLLAGMLDSHPEITCHHELFHSKDIYYSLSHRPGMSGKYPIDRRNQHPDEFLDFIWNYDYKKNNRAIGFKMFPGHNDSLLDRLLHEPTVKKILLERTNVLHLYTSLLISRKTGVYSLLVREDKKSPAPVSVEFDLKAFFAYEKRNRAFYNRVEDILKQTRQDFKRLQYETLLSQSVITGLMEFLGVDARAELLQVRHKKQNPPRLKDRISNYGQVARELKGTRYEIFLDPS